MTTTHPSTDLDRLSNLVEDIVGNLRGQALVSGSRCVDALLDLWLAAPSASARQILAETLDEVRHLSAVRADFLGHRARLVQLAAAVDSVFDHLELRV